MQLSSIDVWVNLNLMAPSWQLLSIWWLAWPCSLIKTKGHFTRGPKYDMDAYMETLFGGKDLCWESGQAKS